MSHYLSPNRVYLLIAFLLLFWCDGKASSVSHDLRNHVWPAYWIAYAATNPSEYGVYLFRKDFELPNRPRNFLVHVSADNRYQLFVNGRNVCRGPQRNELLSWHYDTIDISDFLNSGHNTISAAVWNYGDERPYSIISRRSGFLLQGDGAAEDAVNTDHSWRVIKNAAYQPRPFDHSTLHTFFAAGPGDDVDGRTFPWGWQEPGFSTDTWKPATELDHAVPEMLGTEIDWQLTPRTIPFMDEHPRSFRAIRREEAISVPSGFLAGHSPLVVPAKANVSVLIDAGEIINAFPTLEVTGGRNARVILTYCEALYLPSGLKGDRNDIVGKTALGLQDAFTADGGNRRTFSPLGFRTFRYLQLNIQTTDAPLRIDRLYGFETGYPFTAVGNFRCGNESLNKIWSVGLRTARLCAYETYMDCPYFEQLQYIADTRIQALVTLNCFDDDRLIINAIRQFDASRLASGLTQSRYPSSPGQIIPPYSLFWIDMIHDYWMYRSNPTLIRQLLPGIREVISWFERHVDQSSGLLGPLPFWNFVDWADEWPWIDAGQPGGQPPDAISGNSTILSLQFAYSLRHAADLLASAGDETEAKRYRGLADSVCSAAIKLCWDSDQKMFADSPRKTSYSQHANTFAILAGAITGPQAQQLMRRVLYSKGLIQSSLYFKFYVFEAASNTGMSDTYLAELKPWQEMIDRGLTTFAERPDPTRSDCHAWSASPTYGLTAYVAGIRPSAPGFSSVLIEPSLGPLRRVEASISLPTGRIYVTLSAIAPDSLEAVAVTPIAGTLIWRNNVIPLHPGTNRVNLHAQ